MRNALRKIWTVCAVVVPFATGLAYLTFEHWIPALFGMATGIANALLLIRRAMPLRIPSFVPDHKRTPLEVKQLRYPGRG